MEPLDQAYLTQNRHRAQRLLILMQRRRLLRERFHEEDEEYCRRSAADLRQVLEAEMLAVADGGFLLTVLMELQRACTNFVRAAGGQAKNFKEDPELFQYHLVDLREVFAQRLERVLDTFQLPATDEIQQVISFKS